MGTSSSYGGPGQNKPLLPPWANDPIPDFPPTPPPDPTEANAEPNESPNQPSTRKPIETVPVKPDLNPLRVSVGLSTARSSITKYAGTGNTGFLSGGFKRHTRSLGGAKSGTRAARSGRVATQKLGGFLSGVVSKGIVRAAGDLGIDNIVGKSVAAAISQIVDKLAPAPSTLEEAVTRRAICKTLEELYKRFELDEKGIEALNNINQELVDETVILSAVNYVFERFLLDLVVSIEKGNLSEKDVVKLEQEMRTYIRAEVERHIRGQKDKTKGTIDWYSNEGMQAVNQIYLQVYQILEASK